jgi:hypothetical protein
VTKKDMKKYTRDKTFLADLCHKHQVMLRHWFLGIVPSKIKGHILPLSS